MACYPCTHCNKCGIYSLTLKSVCAQCGTEMSAGVAQCPECGCTETKLVTIEESDSNESPA